MNADTKQVAPSNESLIAASLFRELKHTLSLHSRHGNSDTVRSVAPLLLAALEKRRDEIIAEVLEAGGGK